MAVKPTIPAAGYDFSSFSANNPTTPHSGSSLDTELEQLRQSEREIIAWAEVALADDGDLRSAIVDTKHFSSEALALLESGWLPRGSWLTATAYAVNDYVRDASSSNGYLCVEAHTSGTFATDLAAGKWVLVNVAAAISGHTIKEAGTPLATRAGLNFDGTAFNLTDDAGNDETDVALNFGTGSGQPAEGNHTHSGVFAPLVHTHLRGVVDNTGGYTVTAANHAGLLRITGGGTVSFNAAATLGAGFWVTILAATAAVTIDPTETIDGAGNIVLAAGDSLTVFCTGTVFYTARGVALTNTLQTRGALLTRDASQVIEKAIGAANYLLRSDGTDFAWAEAVGLQPAALIADMGQLGPTEWALTLDKFYLYLGFYFGVSHNGAGNASFACQLRTTSGGYRTAAGDYVWGETYSASGGTANVIDNEFVFQPTPRAAGDVHSGFFLVNGHGDPNQATSIVSFGARGDMSTTCQNGLVAGAATDIEQHDQLKLIWDTGDAFDAGVFQWFKLRKAS